MSSIEVISPGPLTTIQDLGRPGSAHVGVPRSGAADRGSLRQANRLVGNGEGAAALETTLVGPRLRVGADTVVALSGAPVNALAGELAVPMDTAFTLEAGAVLNVGTAMHGLRTYVAFAGGIDAPRTLGSASTDLLTGLGPAPLTRGDRLALGSATRNHANTPRSAPAARQADPDAPLRIVPGPRDDWFGAATLELLTTSPYTVTPASNRVGLRLDGPPLQHARDGQLPSEGLVAGAIQVPPDGRPILLLADHPTTGGYPVIAVLAEVDIDRAAQLRPGQRLRFVSSRTRAGSVSRQA